MDHIQIKKLLAFYRDLNPTERRAIDLHLVGCAACAATLKTYQEMGFALANLTIFETRQAASQLTASGQGPTAILTAPTKQRGAWWAIGVIN